MALYDEFPLTPLDEKARQVYGERVVLKSLAERASFQRLPRYVTEFIIAKYVKPQTWQEDLKKVQDRLRDHLPEAHRREWLKNELLRQRRLVLLDFIEARVNLRSGQRWATVQALGDTKVNVPESLLNEHPGLLLGGMWGTATIEYRPEQDQDAPNHLVAFHPFQVQVHDRRPYVEGRRHFTTDEWLDLLLTSCGYHPQAFPERRTRLLLLCRLIPLVERNVNLIELGPRQTGKTFLLRNLSPRVFTVSGGRNTPANLFYNLARRSVGILGTRKVVVFDEIANTTFEEAEATISLLKDYMESGQYSRGDQSFTSEASIVLCGNLDVTEGQPSSRYRHHFEPLPEELIDTAFLDRIHGYLPGWEIPKLTPQSLAQGVGFVTDYFGEMLVQLREEDYRPYVRQLGWTPGITQRDRVAVERLASGLLKILHPDGRFTDDELREAVALASELRQRVHEQLCILAPGEFRPRLIGYPGLTAHQAHDLRGSEQVVPTEDRLNQEAVVGAITGLVVRRDSKGNIHSGDLVVVQVSANASGSAGLEITGLHGDVLRDSVRTAYHIIEANLSQLGIEPGKFRQARVIVHLVRIAQPREGPSAGLAFVLGIVSALTRRPVKPAVAVTGEVSLHGEVLGVGGVVYKVRAALDAGRKLILLPAENAAELKDLPQDLLSRAEILPVRSIFEAVDFALEGEKSTVRNEPPIESLS
ncbi:MAG: BREX system Lon protease-like protein BrxL [Gemmatales bacterium]|nr:BREX system Lon protease-like protein BrxL [Gemmatales bacterium]MDW8223730.1 BREX system Lon protease-like protein BrxL [Gemmatales bacterium]